MSLSAARDQRQTRSHYAGPSNALLTQLTGTAQVGQSPSWCSQVAEPPIVTAPLKAGEPQTRRIQ